MRTGSMHRELIVAGVVLTLTACGLLTALLLLLGSDVDPSDVPPAEVGVEYVASKPAEPPPPLPVPVRAAEPTAKPEPAPTPAAAAAEPVGDDLLRGRVQTRAAEPIAGARIEVFAGRRLLAEASSGPDGGFSLGPLEPGRFRVEVSAAGYAREELSRTSVPKTPITVILKEGGGISGKVLDDWTGEPLAHASVRVGRPRGGSLAVRRASYDKGSRTDEAGEFRVDGLPEGVYDVAASHRGYGVEAAEGVRVGAAGGADGLVLRLKKEAVVEGRVVDETTGEPVTKALVVFRPPPPAGPRRARTRGDGTFILKGVTAGRATLEVSRTGYTTKFVSGLDLTAGESKTDVEVRLQQGGASLGPEIPMPGGHPGAGGRGRRGGGFQYAGIGAVVQPSKGGQGVEIRDVMPGGAAAEAGLEPGTRILEVDGRPVDGGSLSRAVEWLRGQEGDPVSLRVVGPDGEERLVQPVRKMMTMGKPKG